MLNFHPKPAIAEIIMLIALTISSEERIKSLIKYIGSDMFIEKTVMLMTDDEILLLKNQLCFPAYAAANKILRRYQPLLKELNLTYTQYITMMVMWEKEEVNEKELCVRLYLRANTLTDVLRKLRRKGYIEIKKDETDKRKVSIRISEKGKELKKKAVNIPRTLRQERWLTDEEYETYRKLTYKLLKGDWCK